MSLIFDQMYGGFHAQLANKILNGIYVLLVWIFRIFCSPKSMHFFDCHCQMQLIAMARLLHQNVHNLADVNNQLLLMSATSD